MAVSEIDRYKTYLRKANEIESQDAGQCLFYLESCLEILSADPEVKDLHPNDKKGLESRIKYWHKRGAQKSEVEIHEDEVEEISEVAEITEADVELEPEVEVEPDPDEMARFYVSTLTASGATESEEIIIIINSGVATIKIAKMIPKGLVSGMNML